VFIGRDSAGGAFCFDPWVLYGEGTLDDPNVIVLGKIGQGKSALVKTLLWRMLLFGRRAFVLDVKREYGPLCAAVGVKPISLVPGAGVRLNPLASRPEEHAQLDLLLAQHALTAGESRADDVFDVEARTVHALDGVLHGGLGAGDDVGLDLETAAGHADRVSHPVLAIDGVGAGDDVDDLAIGGDADRARGFDNALHVVLADLVVGARHGDHTRRVLGVEVASREGDDHRFDALARHAFGGHGGSLDGGDGFLQVDDHALAQAVGGALAHADDVDRGAGVVRLGDDHSDPARAKVETDGTLPP